MSKNMLGEALRSIAGPWKDFYQKLCGDDGEEWLDNFKRFLRKEPAVWALDPLLKRVATVQAAGAEKFVAKDELKSANIGWTGENFQRLFLNKEEANVPDAVLVANRLERASLDAPILAELGDKAEVSLAHVFGLLRKQANGEQGILLANGFANILYVRDAEGNLWAVLVRWHPHYHYHYWRVEALSVEYPTTRWHDGAQVCSRDS